MKKVVVLNGSPHKNGCTAVLVDEIMKTAENQGAIVKSYYINGMNINGCQGCYACRIQGKCIQQDDMMELYGEIAKADGIVFATPVYMWQMTAQLKTVVDRLMPFLRKNYATSLTPGKKVLLAVTQGREDTEMFRHYFEHVGKNLVFLGFGEYKILIAGGSRSPEDLYRQSNILEEAAQSGVWLTV
ncbi:MAG: flavodoxin family protein [Anaerocolumna sp.]